MTLAIKHMDLLTQNEARRLLDIQEDPCVSMFMPAVRRGLETQQNPIRLKNLLREAEKRLRERGLRDKDIEKILKPAQSLQRDNNYWEYQCDGLALFLHSGETLNYRLPIEFDELLVINNKFHIKPLLPMLAGDQTFYLLALSQGGVRLLQGTRYTIAEVDLEDAPRSLAEAMRFDDFEQSLQHHAFSSPGAAPQSGKSMGYWHGQGSGGDETVLKDKVLDFFRTLDNGICDLLGDERAPLVLAGVEFIRGYYHKANHYEHLVEEGIEGNPELVSNEELHKEAMKILEPRFERELTELKDRLMLLASAAEPKATFDLLETANAAYLRQIDTLFVPRETQIWGRYIPDDYAVERHDQPQDGDEDLLNFCVEHTLRGRGKVYQLDLDDMPEQREIAAILRPGARENLNATLSGRQA